MNVDILDIKDGTCWSFWAEYYGRILGSTELQRQDKTLKRSLPVTFRVNRSNPRAQRIIRDLEERSDEVQRLEWCDGWQLRFGNVEEIGSRFCEPGLAEWKDWLVRESKDGAIERQEAVSMLPVSVLDVRPGHKVLDMCASPGSKTAQALDALAFNNTNRSGFVLANELDTRRSHILVHRLRGVGRNAEDMLAVVNHNAKTIPKIEGIEFDRIVCDVPCSGDGTLRKNPGLWSHWQPHYGLNLHSTQIQIAMRGLSLLANGGLLVYSTCSMNPIENEAVVGAILEKLGDSVKLENIESTFNSRGLVAQGGLAGWDVVDDTARVFRTFQQAKSRSKPRSCANRFRPTMWPPASGKVAKELEKCIRVLPSDNNTGAFFVALFRKVTDLPNLQQQKKGKKDTISEKEKVHLKSKIDISGKEVSPDLKKLLTSAGSESLRMVSFGASLLSSTENDLLNDSDRVTKSGTKRVNSPSAHVERKRSRW